MARVISLLGDLPVVTADLIRNLRAPDGSRPCPDGLAAGLKWIGDRALAIEDALAEAVKKRNVAQYVGWALAALGNGDGNGDGYGYGYGYGDGNGYGAELG